jgi:hypothetical protein
MMLTCGGRALPGRRTLTAGALALAAGAVVAVPAVASAGSSITVAYPVHGSTHLKAPNTTVSLGPGTLKVTLQSSGALTASLSLPPAKVSITVLGVPVSATTEFLQDGPTTGQVNLSTGAVRTRSKIILKITSMKVLHGLPVPVGNSCESATPAVITLTSLPGFGVTTGGKVAGTYTVPPFANCGLFGWLTPIINLAIAGPGNTITLTLGAGKAA